MPAISASSFAAWTSSSVQVGDLNKSVSEIIADNSKRASFSEISSPFSLNIFFKIVAVQPTGSARKKADHSSRNSQSGDDRLLQGCVHPECCPPFVEIHCGRLK